MQSPAATHTFSPQQEAILTSLFQGANRATACHAAGLPRRTFYNWIKADPVFSEAVEEAEAESIGVAEDLAYECAMKAIEDPRYLRALFFWLKHRAVWIQARPDPVPASAAPSSPAPSPVIYLPDPDAPLVDTDDLASVINLISEFQRREREDEEFMRGYEEWKQLSEEEREAILQEDEKRLTLEDEDLPHTADSAPPDENPAFGVPSVPPDEESGAHEVNGRGTPVACPPPVNTSSENPGIRVPSVPSKPSPNPKSVVPSVPSRQRDKLRMQQFRRKHRK